MIYVITVFILAIAGLEYMHFKERQKLLDRIQARDLAEVKAYEVKPKKKKEEEKPPIEWV